MSRVILRRTELTDALFRGFKQCGIRGRDILTAAVDWRPLEWIAPGLFPIAETGEDVGSIVCRYGILDVLTRTDVYRGYRDTLSMLGEAPSLVMSPERTHMMAAEWTFRLTHQSRCVLSIPEINEDQVAPEAGYIFALEYATALANADVGKLIRGPDHLYVVTNDNVSLGVKDGRPIGFEDFWPVDLSGHLGMYLSLPRGAPWTTHTLDVLDRIYFWYESLVEMPPELEALPDMLTILKTTSTKEYLKLLEDRLLALEPQGPKVNTKEANSRSMLAKIALIGEAEAVLEDWRIPDQEKIVRLVEILIPQVLTEEAFNREIVNLRQRTIYINHRLSKKIRNALLKYKNRITK